MSNVCDTLRLYLHAWGEFIVAAHDYLFASLKITKNFGIATVGGAWLHVHPIGLTFAHAHYEFRTNPYGRGGRGGRFKEDTPKYSYEDEDQSAGGGLRVGMRVKLAQFGVGVVLAVEEHTDDYKITVRFNSVGQKKLLARFAKLEPA